MRKELFAKSEHSSDWIKWHSLWRFQFDSNQDVCARPIAIQSLTGTTTWFSKPSTYSLTFTKPSDAALAAITVAAPPPLPSHVTNYQTIIDKSTNPQMSIVFFNLQLEWIHWVWLCSEWSVPVWEAIFWNSLHRCCCCSITIIISSILI